MKDSIVYDKLGRIPIIHHNEVILNSDIEIHKTKAYIGDKHNSQLMKFIKGPSYGV